MSSSQRKNITQPADWWAAFARQADADGQSLSEWVGDCCRANLPTAEQRKLSERGTVGAPKRARTESN